MVGLVIGTRPDCMPDSLLDYLEEMNRHTFLLVEYGIESTDDKTLAASTAGILSMPPPMRWKEPLHAES